MRDYVRATRECTFDGMKPFLAQAIRAHLEKHLLGALEASALMCCETTSTKQKKGLFGGKAEVILTGILLTPQWLIWAAGKETETPGVLSVKLRDIEVLDYEKTDQYRLIEDNGLSVEGLRTDGVNPGSAFIGLGPEPVSQKFRSLLRDAQMKA